MCVFLHKTKRSRRAESGNVSQLVVTGSRVTKLQQTSSISNFLEREVCLGINQRNLSFGVCIKPSTPQSYLLKNNPTTFTSCSHHATSRSYVTAGAVEAFRSFFPLSPISLPRTLSLVYILSRFGSTWPFPFMVFTKLPEPLNKDGPGLGFFFFFVASSLATQPILPEQ